MDFKLTVSKLSVTFKKFENLTKRRKNSNSKVLELYVDVLTDKHCSHILFSAAHLTAVSQLLCSTR